MSHLLKHQEIFDNLGKMLKIDPKLMEFFKNHGICSWDNHTPLHIDFAAVNIELIEILLYKHGDLETVSSKVAIPDWKKDLFYNNEVNPKTWSQS